MGDVAEINKTANIPMMQQATFNPGDPEGSSNWDFDGVWAIDEGNDYPTFQWEHYVWAAAAAGGRLTEGIEELLGTMEQADETLRVWEGIFAESFVAITYARIVTGG